MPTEPPDPHVLLGNFDRSSDGVRYDLASGQIERLPEGRTVGVPRHGWFVERDGAFMALFRDEDGLWFVTGGERYAVQDADVVRHVDGTEYRLAFSQAGQALADVTYVDHKAARSRSIPTDHDFTAMAGQEHFDWSLFIANVFNEPGRRDRIGASAARR